MGISRLLYDTLITYLFIFVFSYSIVWTVIIIVACVLIVIGSLIYNAVKLLV